MQGLERSSLTFVARFELNLGLSCQRQLCITPALGTICSAACFIRYVRLLLVYKSGTSTLLGAMMAALSDSGHHDTQMNAHRTPTHTPTERVEREAEDGGPSRGGQEQGA